MKKKSFLAIVLVIICSFSMVLPAFATSYVPFASDQISSYSISATAASGGKIAIDFSVTGAGKMSVIGAKSIAIYEKIGSRWEFAKSFSQGDSGMTKANAYIYGNTIYYNGVSGREYRVDVTVFAQDSTGASDSRSKSFAVTAI
ncbi:MAG: hypothetical protein GX025_04260 [Clostridiales bacterium]|nr:hypothetical protein [Clostridiales bacterium]